MFSIESCQNGNIRMAKPQEVKCKFGEAKMKLSLYALRDAEIQKLKNKLLIWTDSAIV